MWKKKWGVFTFNHFDSAKASKLWCSFIIIVSSNLLTKVWYCFPIAVKNHHLDLVVGKTQDPKTTVAIHPPTAIWCTKVHWVWTLRRPRVRTCWAEPSPSWWQCGGYVICFNFCPLLLKKKICPFRIPSFWDADPTNLVGRWVE